MFEAPSNEIFNEMKNKAIQIWMTYDDTHGYATDKIKRVNNLENIQDNAMVFYRMFDHVNQFKFISGLSKQTIDYITNNK